MPRHTDGRDRHGNHPHRENTSRSHRRRSGASNLPVSISLQPGSSAKVTQHGQPPVKLRSTGRGSNSGLMPYDESGTAQWVDTQSAEDRRYDVDTGADSSLAYPGFPPPIPPYSGYSGDAGERQQMIDYPQAYLLMPPTNLPEDTVQDASATAASTASNAPPFVRPTVWVQDHAARTFPPVSNAPVTANMSNARAPRPYWLNHGTEQDPNWVVNPCFQSDH